MGRPIVPLPRDNDSSFASEYPTIWWHSQFHKYFLIAMCIFLSKKVAKFNIIFNINTFITINKIEQGRTWVPVKKLLKKYNKSRKMFWESLTTKILMLGGSILSKLLILGQAISPGCPSVSSLILCIRLYSMKLGKEMLPI